MRRPWRPSAAMLWCSVHVAAVGLTSPFAYYGIRESAGVGIQQDTTERPMWEGLKRGRATPSRTRRGGPGQGVTPQSDPGQMRRHILQRGAAQGPDPGKEQRSPGTRTQGEAW